VLWRIFGPKKDEATGELWRLHSGRLHNLYSTPDLLGRSNRGEWGWRGMWHAWESGETCIGFWWESTKEKDHLKDQSVDGRMRSIWTLRRLGGECGAVVNAVMNLRVLAPRS
jgi:hypothetical protein